MADDPKPVDVRDPDASIQFRAVRRVVDDDGVIHGWDRYRISQDESENITWCNRWLQDAWTKLEAKQTIDCLACLGSDEARYHGDP